MSKHNHPKSYTKTTTQDSDHDGVPEQTTIDSFVYDKKGQLIETGSSYDWGGDGVPAFTTLARYGYDNKGRAVYFYNSADDNGDGQIDWTTSTTNTYEKNNLVNVVSDSHIGADGTIDALSVTNNTFNRHGIITSSLMEYDGDNNGTLEYSQRIDYEYEGKRLVRESYDTSNDGSVDMVYTYTYTDKNGSYDKVITNDGDADGIPESIITEKYVLDRKGNLTSLTTLSDYDANGSIDYGTSTEYTRDKQGRITKEVYTADEFWDGTPDYVQTLNTTYGKDGVSRIEFIMDYNGGNDYRWVIDNTYNKGLLKSAVTSWDFDLNGAINQTDTVSYFYEGKNLIREEQDYYTDGTVETVTSYDYLTA